ncbi:cyclically-permuted mutarotase family protein [uncultured Bacteroides sp.]|uniref:cyclically-permuted mutarotase family protein n=1 Tax=uncultured Bacteroides sp. TaxID=162156 RepID=UPI0025DC4DAB|nr:cyclically-permuted mutarotase family protein [uncultured Bacteroides sp.]
MKKILILSLCLFACWALSAQQKRTKVACVGNSITYGTGLSDRATQSYPVQLQKLLGDRYEVGNFGKPGATLLNQGHRPYTQQEEYRKALDFAGDIVVIHLGINDTDPRNWPNYRDFFVKDYLNLIDTFRQVNPDARIIVARMTPIADRHPRFLSGTRDWHGEIQTAIETVARYAGVQLTDFHEPLYPYPFLLPDAVHPTAEGATIMAGKVYSAITGDYGGLKLSPLYTDHMVLQRDTPLLIQGTADAGEQVTVRIDGQQWSTQTAADGKWSLRLSPLKAGGPYTLTISTPRKTLKYTDVLIGEVWLCSGQSNMEFMLNQSTTGQKDIPQAANGRLRLYDMKARWRTNPVQWDASVLDSLNHLQYYKETTWQTCTPDNAARFSAIAYYFGRMLQDSLKVPVGLICNAVGGSPAEAWVDRHTLEYHFPAILKDWTNNDFIQDWVRGRAALNVKLSKEKFQRHPYEPCYLYEAGIRPLEQYPLKGVIWYQGESNAHNREAHEKLFQLLVGSWRKNWKNEELPFYYVQLSSIARPSWPWFRDSQRRLMNGIPHTGMAVSSDCGDSLDVHPRNKKPIGERLARWALHQTYGLSDVVPSGPLFRCAEFREDAVFVTFDYGKGLKSSDGAPLRTFEVAETDGVYYPAVAEVVDGKVKVYSKQVKHPRYIRYGWQPFTRANLENEEGLPASTFRAEAPGRFVTDIRWQKMAGFPRSEKGITSGVSACYSGILRGELLMAGGCNFPGTPASAGGKKKFYRGIYAATLSPDTVLAWRKVGELPVAAAYGVSVSCPDGIICIGGTDGKEALTSVFKISWGKKPKAAKQRKVAIESLPALPYALDNMCGTLVGRQLFVAGGNKNGKPSNSFLCLDLDHPEAGWQELPGFPGDPRTQAVCAGQLKDGEARIFLWGGFAASADGKPATLSTDGYCYSSASRQWTPVAAPTSNDGETISLGGGTAVAIHENLIFCTGGVNKDIFLAALRNPEKDYLLHPVEWYRFNDRILVYNISQDTWQEVARTPHTARAGAALTGWDKTYYHINGELKPSIRTPEIVRITLE